MRLGIVEPGAGGGNTAQVNYAGLEWDLRAAEGLVEPGRVESWAEAPAPSPGMARVELLTATAEALAGKRPARFWLKVKRTFAPAALRRRLRAELDCLTAMLPEQVRRDIDVPSETERAGEFRQLSEACGRLDRLARWRFADDKCGRALATIGAEEPADVLSQELDQLQCRRAELAFWQDVNCGSGGLEGGDRSKWNRHAITARNACGSAGRLI